MTKRPNIILTLTLIVATIVTVYFVGIFLFPVFLYSLFVGNYDPIKEYSYSLSVKDLKANTIDAVNETSGLYYILPDTIGFPTGRFTNYLTIEISDSDKKISWNSSTN